MSTADGIGRRDLLQAGLCAAGLWPALVRGAAVQPQDAATAAIGKRQILQGLDGMSRVADGGRDPFVDGHTAAAVISSAFFWRENGLDAPTQQALSLVEARLLQSPIFAPRPEEPADPRLVAGLVADLDAGIGALRHSGHDIIFVATSLRALREVPEAATPARVQGLRAMVKSLHAGKERVVAVQDEDSFPDLRDVQRFLAFVFEEYLRALDLYRRGRGHHGFAGHVLTVGHALFELHRLGHPETAHKGLRAYRQFVQLARNGDDLGGQPVAPAPEHAPSPLQREYWLAQARRRVGPIVSSHLIKYPYSFYALAKELPDGELKRRAFEPLFHLTAVS